MAEKRLFMYVTRPARLGMVTEGPTPEEAEIVSRHVDYLEALGERGALLLAGRTQENTEVTFGIMILETESEEEARAIMENDPAVAEGIMRAHLHPYRVAVWGRALRPVAA
jgi:uncharacterized protein YciI